MYFSAVWLGTVQAHVPRGTFARVNSYVTIGSFGLLPAGFALAGAATAWVGSSAVLWLSAVWLVLSTAAAVSAREIRSLRRIDEEAAAEERVAAATAEPASAPEAIAVARAPAETSEGRA